MYEFIISTEFLLFTKHIARFGGNRTVVRAEFPSAITYTLKPTAFGDVVSREKL